jgi:phosphoserine phosphatase RsbU/P
MVKTKILVVDDVKKNIQLLGSILVKDGYAVSYATNGAKALAMIAEENFDIILLDVMMPEMDGFAVCRHLKQDPKNKDIPVLFLTAKSEKDDIVLGFQQGAVDYLTKPFNVAELLARVKTHLALRQAQIVITERNAELEQKNRQLEQLLEENRKSMSEIRILRGILPICSHCKKIRNDEGYWTQLESYIKDHSEAEFTHGICADCAKEHYSYLVP